MVLVKRFIMFSFIKQILLITLQSGALKDFGHYHYDVSSFSTYFCETIELWASFIEFPKHLISIKGIVLLSYLN